jgi:hypothetical protein
MGALGQDLKSQVEALIDDPNLLSTSTIQQISFSEGTYGGYTDGTATISGTASVNVIPSNYIQTRTGLQLHGDLQEGELRLLMKEEETIDAEDDRVLFQGERYIVREIKPIFFNEETIAKAVILAKTFVIGGIFFPMIFPGVFG